MPPRQSQYSVGCSSSLGSAAPVNPSLLAVFERPLGPSLHLGLTLRETFLLESSSRALSEAQSHTMWLLSGLLGFVCLQGFSPLDSPLFNTLVSSLSKCLAHQASVSASLTAFMGIKRRQFYLSHLPAYFSDINKRSMLAAPLVCADSLFLESDVTRLLSDTQTSSSLKSQQAMVDVASHRSGPRRRRASPARSPARSSPSRRRCRDSGSPSRSSKRVRFDSPTPSSALKPLNKGFRRQEPWPSSRKVGGCLAAHWVVWEAWGADAWVVQVLHFGYRIPFRSRPPLSHVPIPLPSYSPDSIRGLALSDAVCALVEKEAIEIAPPSPGFYSRLFVTPKVTGGWWPVIDLSRLNGWVELSSFRMKTAQSVLLSLRPGDWMVSLDLQDAYLQVLVHPASRCFLRFCVGDAVFQFRALCFGLSSAPQVFTRVMDPIASIMHRHDFRLLRYLDDWLVLGSTFQDLVRARDFLLWLCRHLGVIVNLSKSSLVQTQTLDYLGMTLETFPLRVFPTLKRVQKFSLLRQAFLSDRLQPIVPGSRLCMGFLQLPSQCGRSSPARRPSCLLGRWLPQGSSVVVR